VSQSFDKKRLSLNGLTRLLVHRPYGQGLFCSLGERDRDRKKFFSFLILAKKKVSKVFDTTPFFTKK
jgi:hypothetical protein